MFPQLQYASSGAICWKNEIVVDNQVVPWDEQNTLVWEQNFISRCQEAWINPLLQRTEQIGQLVVDNHQTLERRVQEQTFQWDNLRQQVLAKVQEMEIATHGACQQLSNQVQQVLSTSSQSTESVSSLEREQHNLLTRTEELFTRQQTEIQALKHLAGKVQQLQGFAKDVGEKDKSLAEILNRLGQQIQVVQETSQLLSSRVHELEKAAQEWANKRTSQLSVHRHCGTLF